MSEDQPNHGGPGRADGQRDGTAADAAEPGEGAALATAPLPGPRRSPATWRRGSRRSPPPTAPRCWRTCRPTTAADVAEYLDPETAGRILSEMDPQRAASVLCDMEAPEASMVVAAMAPDDRVDVLEHVPDAQHDAILGEMDAEDAADVLELEKYPPDTAGGIMTTRGHRAGGGPDHRAGGRWSCAGSAKSSSRCGTSTWWTAGTTWSACCRSATCCWAGPTGKLRQIMRTQVSTVLATMDQEEVARLFRRYNYLAMPVVDARHRLVGLITFDDAADVIEEEATEDVQKLFGAGAGERLTSPWPFSFRKRIGWLEVQAGDGLRRPRAVIAAFDDTIAAVPVLAAYLAVVAGMGGNAGRRRWPSPSAASPRAR